MLILIEYNPDLDGWGSVSFLTKIRNIEAL